MFMGDKNRGLAKYVIERIHTDLNGFDNFLAKVDQLTFAVSILSNGTNIAGYFSYFLNNYLETISFKDYFEFQQFFASKLNGMIYKKTIVITISAAVSSPFLA